MQISFLVILSSYAKFELNSSRNNKVTLKLLITDILAFATKRKSEMTSYLNNGYDVMNYFAKFKAFLPPSIIIPSFMTIGSQMPELERGGGGGGAYEIGSQNTPYKLGLTILFH